MRLMACTLAGAWPGTWPALDCRLWGGVYAAIVALGWSGFRVWRWRIDPGLDGLTVINPFVARPASESGRLSPVVGEALWPLSHLRIGGWGRRLCRAAISSGSGRTP